MSKFTRPLPADKVIEFVSLISQKPVEEPVDRGMKGATIGIIDDLLGSRGARTALLFRLFPGKWNILGEITSNDLTEGEWCALCRWVGTCKPPGEKWQGSPDFIIECAQLNYHLDARPGQEHLNSDFFAEFCVGRFGCIPTMKCGHPADSLAAIFNPFCSKCSDGGENKEAYKILADVPLAEMKEA